MADIVNSFVFILQAHVDFAVKLVESEHYAAEDVSERRDTVSRFDTLVLFRDFKHQVLIKVS